MTLCNCGQELEPSFLCLMPKPTSFQRPDSFLPEEILLAGSCTFEPLPPGK